MDYNETLQFLFSQLPMYQRIGGAAYKADLGPTLRLDEYFGHPHRQYHTVHVAGTNGKGSTSHMLAAMLRAQGLRVGLYTSPHLVDFRERIKIDGQMIARDEVVSWVERHRGVIEAERPSFFEMTAALAFDHFARQRVDVAVVEVGMGGRLDSTNIITPLVSVVTNIGLDHTQFLGTTLEQIAAEKAGIAKPGVPLVVGEPHPLTLPVFREAARRNNAPLVLAQECYRVVSSQLLEDQALRRFCLEAADGKPFEACLDLMGEYQERNIVTALAAFDLLAPALGADRGKALAALPTAARDTGLWGRWQLLARTPRVVADIGHNSHGISALVGQIQRTPHARLRMVVGAVSDKDVASMLRLLPSDADYYLTQPSVPRAMAVEILSQRAAEIGIAGRCFSSVNQAIASALADASPDDMLYIGGSAFVVADALECWPRVAAEAGIDAL